MAGQQCFLERIGRFRHVGGIYARRDDGSGD
jgi:hypothetical protein